MKKTGIFNFLGRFCINTILFLAIAGFFKENFYIASFKYAVIAGLILSCLNAVLKPLLMLLSLPITFLTLGLFSIIINSLMLEMTSILIGYQYFHIVNFGMAILAALIMSFCNTVIFNYFIHN